MPFRQLILILSVFSFSFSVASSITASTYLDGELLMDKNERRARQKLSGISQDHLFTYWSELNDGQKKHLLDQIDRLDVSAFKWQQAELKKSTSSAADKISPFTDFAFNGDPSIIELGKKLLSEGRVGCIVVAGGQGTRLRFDGPKGAYPISVVKHKSLFQILAEKVVAAGRQAGKMLQLAIMTSPQNHDETVRFFQKNGNFGLSSLQLSFFPQGMLSLLDTEGNLFLEDKCVIAEGADGNGSCLKSFVESGIWERWKTAGITQVNFIPVDNPLADPYDANLIGLHAFNQNEVTIKCIERKDPKEKVGLLIRKNDHVDVIEYSEVSEEEQTAKNGDGFLKHRCANLSLFCFGMDFIQEAAAATGKLPLHLAFKAVKTLDAEGKVFTPVQPNAWKFERFIFDVLPLTDRVSAVIYPRERCFSPLKNFSGSDTPETVQAALQALDKITFESLAGAPAPDGPFELSQDFYYPTPEFQQKWQGGSPPKTDYLDRNSVPEKA